MKNQNKLNYISKANKNGQQQKINKKKKPISRAVIRVEKGEKTRK